MFLGHSVVVVSSSARLATGLMTAFHTYSNDAVGRACVQKRRGRKQLDTSARNTICWLVA